MQNSGSPQLDLTGKLIIKVALGDDIRRIPIHNEDITYDELVLMMQRVYRGKLSTNDEVTIKYKDEDGDLITIFDSSDLSFAIQCSRILKITLFVGGPKSFLGPSDPASIRRELQEVRDRVIDLLDRLEPSPLVGATQGLSLADGISGKGDVTRESPLPLSNGMKAINSVGGKEFDPLKSQLSNDSTQSKVMASFGGPEANASSSVSQAFDRAATPDSISSIGSSASNQIKAQQSSQQLPVVDQQQQQQHIQQQQPQQAPPQQQQPQQAPPQQQPQTPSQTPNQSVPQYAMTHPGQMPQMYAGQPGYASTPQVPGQPTPQQQQQQPQQQQQQQVPPTSQQQQVPPQQQQPGYDSGMYNQYNPGYPGAAGQPGPYGQQPQQPGPYGQQPYGQAPGMPQLKPAGYGPTPPGPPQAGQSPGNPYSRGAPTYSSGYPRPSAGYPQ